MSFAKENTLTSVYPMLQPAAGHLILSLKLSQFLSQSKIDQIDKVVTLTDT